MWKAFGAVIATTSTAGSFTSAFQSPVDRAKPSCRAASLRDLVAPVGQHRQLGLQRQIENLRHRAEGESMGLSHEAAADKADAEAAG